ncbi:MAG: guanine deaminase [Gammaproteobacteria bacterium]|nr:guanine deaminase [Gammaproteobacteria bacterium]|tara:strand:- start:341 stop:1624 length:1284 start_codon:yes stop_codon:yes gene_type:complete
MRAIRARLLHVESTGTLRWKYLEDGVIIVESGLIKEIVDAGQGQRDGLDLSQCEDRRDMLLIPGLIDTHVHSPQIDVIASYSGQLLDWLDKYTFPAESRYSDPFYAEQSAHDFLDGLIAAGTTTAMVYVTSHEAATDRFFAAAYQRQMRMIGGKVLMDRLAPANLCDDAKGGEEASARLIKDWHGKGRLGYAITPRFAVTSSPEQLASAGRLHKAYPDTWIQTHLSENHEEIRKVSELYPDITDYLSVYDRFGLLTERSVFGHCLHLSEAEISLLATKGGRVAFCPSSNLFLGSGLIDLKVLREAGAMVGIASDVGGGTSLSMFRTLGDAFKVCQLRGYSLSAMEAFAMATLGNAELLGLDSLIGNLAKGKEADLVLLKPKPESIMARRVGLARSIEEELFVYMTMADETLVAETIVNGVTVGRRND